MQLADESELGKGYSMQTKKDVTVFEIRDLVIPILPLPAPCQVRVQIDEERIRLFIGPRTIEWSTRSGEVLESTVTE